MTNHGKTADHGTIPSSTTAASGANGASGVPRTRRLVLLASAAVGLWVLASFAGTMLDPARASLWTGSLMWSLLASLLVSPALLMAGSFGREHARPEGERSLKATSSAMPSSEAMPSDATFSETTSSDAAPFVGKGARLWPEPAELREKAELRRKAAAFEAAAFEDAAFEDAASEDGVSEASAVEAGPETERTALAA